MAFETRPQSSSSSISQINVVPLVDVMLVLLVIFMVTAPILQQGIDVDLPDTDSGPLEGKDDQLVVSVDREGEVYLNDQKIDLPELTKRLAAIREQRPGREAYLRADEKVPYGAVVRVMAAVREAGIANLGMVTELPEP